jgi:hypothetical protein
MRVFVVLAAFALAACGQPHTPAQAAQACAREATHEVVWTTEGAPDTVTARAEGPSCAQAVVTMTIRNASGDPLWAFASPYFDLTLGGVGPEGAPDVMGEEMDTFLAGWANVSVMQTGELPEWRADAATLTESVQGMAYDTPFDREVYEAMRARNLTMICYAAAAEASQCLIVDPASHSPTMIVAFGA